MKKTWKDEVEEKSFINGELIETLLEKNNNPSDSEFDLVMEKAKRQERLSIDDVSILLNSDQEDRVNKIFSLAKDIKERVYGNRVVLFAPLYIGNKCTNSCTYCGFKVTNDIMRKSLSLDEVQHEVEALVDEGHKRVIMVYGTHPDYPAEYIKDTVKKAYTVKKVRER